MYFNSYIFVLAFLPIVLLGYYGINKTGKYKLGQIWLLIMSLVFIGYLNSLYIAAIIVSIIIGYLFILSVTQKNKAENVRKIWLIVGIVIHVGVLLFFKYYNFFVESINSLLKKDYTLLNLLIPLGISFYTFQQIAYLVDCYREPDKKCNFLEYALYITYFPKFLQGPILLHEDMVPQLRTKDNKLFSSDSFAKGIYMFALGLGKKVLLADSIAYLVNAGYGSISSLNTLSVILTIVAYSLQLYFDFSGYCDMAMGVGEMLQIRVPMNFDSPYKAVKITEIWSRWHMTLTRFFTKYVYIPLGGNRKGAVKMYANTFIVFLISGLWHGAAWTFVVWGILHGIAMIVSKLMKQCNIVLPKIIGWFMTFSFWVCSFAIFRAVSLSEAKQLFFQLLYGGTGRINSLLSEVFDGKLEVSILQRMDVVGILDKFPEVIPVALVVISLSGCLFMQNTQQKAEQFKPTYSKMLVTVTLIFYSVMSLGGISQFLYVNF